MINRLLIGLDGSNLAESALSYAERLGQAARADLLLVRAVPPEEASDVLDEVNPRWLPYMAAMPSTPPGSATAPPHGVLHEAAAYLDAIGTRLNQRGLACQAVAATGDAADVLLEEAKELDANLIVLGTHGRSVLGRWMHGSVAEAVLARSPVPVLLVRDGTTRTGTSAMRPLTSILVPLDGSPMAEAALPWAAELARLLSAELHLVRIVPPLVLVPGDELQGVDVAAPVLAEDLDEGAARAYLEDVAEPLRAQGLPTTSMVRTGHVAAEIVNAAEECDAGLIVMATHGRTGLARVLLGSVALQVLHREHRPLLVVGPHAGSGAMAQHGPPSRRAQTAERKAS